METREEIYILLDKAIRSEEPIDVLPMCRLYPHVFSPWQDSAMDWDIGYQVFHGGFMGLYGMGFQSTEEDEDSPLDGNIFKIDPSIYEYDMVSFASHTSYITVYRVIKDLAIILQSDCSGCCNALSFIKISKHGLVSSGNISQTYHS